MKICNIDYLLKKYPYLGNNAFSYQIESLQILIDQVSSVKGLDVLEIGGALPAELTIDQLGANSWTCIEKMDYWSTRNKTVLKSRLDQVKSKNYRWRHYNSCIFDWLDDLESAYDIIYSCCAFEHIDDINELLSASFRSLRKGGTLFAYFLPVYSSFNGHHCPDFYANDRLVAEAKLPPFCHLLYSPAELLTYLKSIYTKDIADYFYYSIVRDPHINRMMYDDYVVAVNNSMFSTKCVHGLFPQRLNKEILSHLTAKRGNYSYHFTGITFALRK